MSNSHSDSYKAAGVDVTAGYKAVELMKGAIARTNVPGVYSGIGGFGGLFVNGKTVDPLEAMNKLGQGDNQKTETTSGE